MNDRFFCVSQEEKAQLIRFFDHKTFFTVHGESAVLIAQQYYKTSVVVKHYGSSPNSALPGAAEMHGASARWTASRRLRHDASPLSLATVSSHMWCSPTSLHAMQSSPSARHCTSAFWGTCLSTVQSMPSSCTRDPAAAGHAPGAWHHGLWMEAGLCTCTSDSWKPAA